MLHYRVSIELQTCVDVEAENLQEAETKAKQTAMELGGYVKITEVSCDKGNGLEKVY